MEKKIFVHVFDPVTKTARKKKIAPLSYTASYTDATRQTRGMGSRVVHGEGMYRTTSIVLESVETLDVLEAITAAKATLASVTEATTEILAGNVAILGHTLGTAAQGQGVIPSGIQLVTAATTATTAVGGTLPAIGNGSLVVFHNTGASVSATIYGLAADTGVTIDGVAGATGVTVAAGKTVSFYSKDDGATTKQWFTIR